MNIYHSRKGFAFLFHGARSSQLLAGSSIAGPCPFGDVTICLILNVFLVWFWCWWWRSKLYFFLRRSLARSHWRSSWGLGGVRVCFPLMHVTTLIFGGVVGARVGRLHSASLAMRCWRNMESCGYVPVGLQATVV